MRHTELISGRGNMVGYIACSEACVVKKIGVYLYNEVSAGRHNK